MEHAYRGTELFDLTERFKLFEQTIAADTTLIPVIDTRRAGTRSLAASRQPLGTGPMVRGRVR